ncbi:ABC transporter ATP-binding protein [Halonotius roseus]|uniref:ABC transporter ATP-binding protein n=1 Tax=Halonotius roseus TaxID=2511997 RepID=A0A544QMN5_9EURY|nr:ABC transporter ATP-binding protein [Halonotius roseus]TQQ80150.1 ABC transporter ATP-binding protein [Halonotius roseus]
MTDADDAESRSATGDSDGSTSVVTTTGLTKEYGGRPIFDGVDLDINAGAMTAVIGPNGSGKTTLLKTLLGHVDPTAGTVTYTGPDVDRPMGYLPQEPAFRPQFTVSETVEFYASLVDASVDTEGLLREVNLYDARTRRVSALSGGMRRLLAVAQAVLGDPPVVCCDEPASGLDPSMARRVFESLAGRAADGMAVVVASHTLSLVETYADHVVILDAGGVAAAGSPAALIERYDAADLWDVYATVVDPATAGVSRRGDDDDTAERDAAASDPTADSGGDS